MEGRKENKYNLSGICPECGKLVKIELKIATDFIKQKGEEEQEGKPDEGKGEAEGKGAGADKGKPVRRNRGKRPAGTAAASEEAGAAGASGKPEQAKEA